jgi:hypothetical protein
MTEIEQRILDGTIAYNMAYGTAVPAKDFYNRIVQDRWGARVLRQSLYLTRQQHHGVKT